MSVSAYDFEVDGIYYNITSDTDKTAEVTYKGISYTEYDEYFGVVTIPEFVTYCGNTYSVTGIGNYAFYGCYDLNTVEIGKSVTSIGRMSFASCSNLTSVEIPNSVTSIGDYAFYYCYGLTSVVIPNSLTSIEAGTFAHCSNLISAVIPNSVTSIGGEAFWCCSNLTSIEIPNSVTSIGFSAFGNCLSLTSINIPNSVTNIGHSAFENTAWFNSQPDGIVYLDKYLLSYKGTIPTNTSINIKDGTILIADGAFSAGYNLTSVEIPNSVTRIGNTAFLGCSSLTFIEIPNSVTSIGDAAFSSCTGLTFIEIPNSVISIGNQTFIGCSGLNIVEIGNSVTRIGEYAFYDCENLTKFISYAEVPPVCGNSVFYGVKKDFCVLQVPQSCLAAYQQADQWKEFFFIEDVLTAIGGVTVDGAVPATADVYSTNGMLIKRNAELNNLKHELPAGIYVIGGKKVYVK